MSCSKCVKVTLIVLNIFFWLFGLGLLGVGIWINVDVEVTNVGTALTIGISDNVINIASWIFIGAGLFTFLVGFFGCCGAIRESQILLGLYMTCLLVAFAAEIGAVVVVGVKYNDIENKIRQDGKIWLLNEYDEESVASKGLNYVQFKFCCCGVNDYLDYRNSEYQKKSRYTVPKACCQEDKSKSTTLEYVVKDRDQCENEAAAYNSTQREANCDSNFRSGGCYDALVAWGKDHMVGFICAGAGVALFQVIIFILAVFLCVAIRRDDK